MLWLPIIIDMFLSKEDDEEDEANTFKNVY